MSNTAKHLLQAVLSALDALFARMHPADAEEVVKELRERLAAHKAAMKRGRYDHHTNAATDA